MPKKVLPEKKSSRENTSSPTVGSLSFDFYSTLAHQSGSDLDSFDAVAGKVGKHQGHEIGFNTGKDIFVLDDQHAQYVCVCVCVCVCTCCLSTFLSPIPKHTHTPSFEECLLSFCIDLCI